MNKQRTFSAAEQQIITSMTELLARAGLEYQGRFIEVDNQQIHYLDYGERAPVLLLHGGGAGSAIWFRQIEALSKTHRVIAPDHPVFGLSSQRAFEPPFVESLVRYLSAFMDTVGLDKVDVVGLSMGGQGALALAIDRPERIDRVVVIDSAGLGKAFPLLFKLANVPLLGRLITRPSRMGQDNYFKTMEVANSEFADANAYRQYAYDVTLSDGHSRAMRSSLSTITGMRGQKEIFTDTQLMSITAPALAIWGDQDPLFPVEHGYRLAKLAPDARLHVIEDARHVPLLDHADAVNELIVGFVADS